MAILSRLIYRSKSVRSLKRRHFIGLTAGLALLPNMRAIMLPAAQANTRSAMSRVRPGDSGWPKDREWQELNRVIGGNLIKPRTIWQACAEAPLTKDCLASIKEARNPFALGDDAGGTQISGWLDAWTPRASAYAVAARSTSDVVAGVNFARRHNLRMVVKGGGH